VKAILHSISIAFVATTLLAAAGSSLPAAEAATAARACKAPSVDAGWVRKLRHDTRTTCGQARSVASEWVARYLDGSSTRRLGGWRCEGRSRISCARGKRLIRFSYGV
jgi:hypothetical protein